MCVCVCTCVRTCGICMLHVLCVAACKTELLLSCGPTQLQHPLTPHTHFTLVFTPFTPPTHVHPLFALQVSRPTDGDYLPLLTHSSWHRTTCDCKHTLLCFPILPCFYTCLYLYSILLNLVQDYDTVCCVLCINAVCLYKLACIFSSPFYSLVVLVINFCIVEPLYTKRTYMCDTCGLITANSTCPFGTSWSADGTFTGGPNMMSSTMMSSIILYINICTSYYVIYYTICLRGCNIMSSTIPYLYLCLPMSTYAYLCLPMSTYVYLCLPICLPVSTYVYLCLPMSTYVYLCLPVSTCVYLCLPICLPMSTCVYLCLPVSTYVYLCLPMSTYVYTYMSTYVYLCLPVST